MSEVNRITVCLVLLLAIGSAACDRRANATPVESAARTESSPSPSPAKVKILCGAPTKKGAPCRRPVKSQGDRCHLHKGTK